MELELGNLRKCPFFKSTPGCVSEAVCGLSGKSRTELGDGLYIKPQGCEYPLITNNNCEVEDVQGVLPSGVSVSQDLIGGKKELIFP